MTAKLLDIAGLSVRFGATAAVSEFFLSVARGEAVGIVGESGSGKSAAMLAVLGLHPPGTAVSAERHLLGGTDVRRALPRQLRALRGSMAAMIFQDPLAALNPLLPVGVQIAEVLVRHKGLSKRDATLAARALLFRVGIHDAGARETKYPHEFSGGMRQRVMIAAALAGDPALLIADEPTTALDVTVQADIARLIVQLQRERQMGLIWVTHDLALMAGIVDRVVVMYAGRIMEVAPVAALYFAPRHPYTVALLASLPRLDRKRASPLPAPQAQAAQAAQAAGCPFAPRCGRRMAKCEDLPPLFEIGDSLAACWALT